MSTVRQADVGRMSRVVHDKTVEVSKLINLEPVACDGSCSQFGISSGRENNNSDN